MVAYCAARNNWYIPIEYIPSTCTQLFHTFSDKKLAKKELYTVSREDSTKYSSSHWNSMELNFSFRSNISSCWVSQWTLGQLIIDHTRDNTGLEAQGRYEQAADVSIYEISCFLSNRIVSDIKTFLPRKDELVLKYTSGNSKNWLVEWLIRLVNLNPGE